VRSPALLADGPTVQPGGIAGHLARAAGEVIASLVSDCAVSAMAGAR
jgi:hypothetical protein